MPTRIERDHFAQNRPVSNKKLYLRPIFFRLKFSYTKILKQVSDTDFLITIRSPDQYVGFDTKKDVLDIHEEKRGFLNFNDSLAFNQKGIVPFVTRRRLKE